MKLSIAIPTIRYYPSTHFGRNGSNKVRAMSVESSSIWSAPTCLVVNPRYGLKAFSVILAWIRAFGTDARDAIRDDASREKLHREFAVLWFLRGPHGGSGEGSGFPVSVGAGTGQEVWHAEPGNRRVKWHRQRAHATCTRMIWFVLFQFRLSVLIRTVPFCATRIARMLLVIPIFSVQSTYIGWSRNCYLC